MGREAEKASRRWKRDRDRDRDRRLRLLEEQRRRFQRDLVSSTAFFQIPGWIPVFFVSGK